MMPELDGMGLLAKLGRELPHVRPSIVVVTAMDLGRVELQRLSDQTVAVLRKNGELEAQLRSVLQELWGRTSTAPFAPAAAAS